MPQRVMSGLTIQQAINYGLQLYLYSVDDPANNEYNPIHAPWGAPAWTNVLANHEQPLPHDIIIDAVDIHIDVPPGVGATRRFTLIDGGGVPLLPAMDISGAISAGVHTTNIQTTIPHITTMAWKHTIPVGAPAAISWVAILITYHLA